MITANFGSVTKTTPCVDGRASSTSAASSWHPIKSVGTHDVEVRLHREVAAHIQVEVIPEGKESIIEEAPAPKAAAAPAAPATEAEA